MRRRHWDERTRRLLLERQHHRCAIDGAPLALHDSHIDHITPLTAGGDDDFHNLQLVHPSCNTRKGKKHHGPQTVMPWA